MLWSVGCEQMPCRPRQWDWPPAPLSWPRTELSLDSSFLSAWPAEWTHRPKSNPRQGAQPNPAGARAVMWSTGAPQTGEHENKCWPWKPWGLQWFVIQRYVATAQWYNQLQCQEVVGRISPLLPKSPQNKQSKWKQWVYHANAALKNSLSDGLPTVYQLPWEFWSGRSWPQPLPLKVGTAAWAGLSPGTWLTLPHASPRPHGGSDFRLKAEAFIPTVMWRVWIPVGDKPRQVKSIQVSPAVPEVQRSCHLLPECC